MVAKTTISQKVTKTAPAAPVAVAAAAPATAPVAPVAPVKPAPVVDMTARPATQAEAKPASNKPDETAMMLGGGALALALGGGAFALARRRREEDEVIGEVEYAEPMPEPMPEPMAVETPRHDPVVTEQPTIIAPPVSAFAWGASPKAEAPLDKHPDESWVDRAMRGPTPDNPSLSLRKRLKRAAFFDKRDREVAAGVAKPVEADAGLPEAAVDERELELA